MWLKKEEFLGIVDRTPLVSIDLLVQRTDGAVLLGRRKNRPAQGFWFVPGGRIRKDEAIQDALCRIVRSELGDAIPVTGWEPFGFWEHRFPDNFADQEGVRTHYLVLAHRMKLPSIPLRIEADDQHESLRWWTVGALQNSEAVHEYTKAYFREKVSTIKIHDGIPVAVRA